MSSVTSKTRGPSRPPSRPHFDVREAPKLGEAQAKAFFEAKARLRDNDSVQILPSGSNLPEGYQPLLQAVARMEVQGLRGRPNAAPATGFYIGGGLLLTAGHVFSEPDSNGSLLFDRKEGSVSLNLHFGLGTATRFVDRRKAAPPLTETPDGTVDQHGFTVLEEAPRTGQIIDAAYGDRGDFAIISIPQPWPKVEFELGNGTEAQLGDSVVLFGSSEGTWPMLWKGELVDTGGGFYGYLPSTAAGTSGAPLIHEKSGKVIGIHSSRLSIQNPDPKSQYPLDSVSIAGRIERLPQQALLPAPHSQEDGWG